MAEWAAKRSRTAQAVVAQRAVLNGIGAIDEPFAQQMLTPFMAAISSCFQKVPPSLRSRWVTVAGCAGAVQWFDAQVADALDTGIQQVAVIGAGYDTRAWRFERDGVHFVELDRGVTQRDKIRRAPQPGQVFVEADLATDSAPEVLLRGGLDPTRPTLFVLEGLTMYLSEELLQRLLGDLAASSAAGSRVMADFYSRPDSGTSRNRRQLFLQWLARVGSGEGLTLQVDSADAVVVLEASGWTVDQQLGFREAAQLRVLREVGLPLGAVNDAKTLVAGHRL